jgi:hypothetical protein
MRDAHLVLAFFTMRREEEEVRVSEWRLGRDLNQAVWRLH